MSPKRIVVLISGSGSNLQAILDQTLDGQINGKIAAVISNRPDAFGLTRAEQAGVVARLLDHKAFADRESFDAALIELIDSYQPDLVVLAGFMRILTPELVRHYHGRLFNIHPSLLPKYKGLHTHQRALEAGDAEHGCTVHFVTEELDGGPLIVQAKTDILTGDDEQSLQQRVHQLEHQIYPLAVQWFCEERLSLSGDGVMLDGELLATTGYQYTTR
ncbi:phosphoribosylglycinamide formyltransferase [Marinobacterium sediminicola]|uniref:Phosphoribosylglycinamide formyltransferase n=1 Tax=Marinobacterium sediminicola TaxID=518898 RepID=A0ABY1RW90_9GAMM|nr:phosphoribosylglycinamide formyltransferase [Marinobacterium sediminicola]ULG70394.1 phosphoribosylglycinamide formyltransferase [Marinobacterium sediminicola]SMR69508.1 phosphoribosylglycinamide formyltransferase-1 [Marinobacterium sediminicola]